MSGKERRIRYSEIKKFMRCRRSWMNGYYMQLGLPERSGDREPSTASTGTLVHEALHEYYMHGKDPVDWINQQTPPAGAFAAEWGKTYTLARIMVEGYMQWLTEEGHDAGEQTVGAELELEMDFGIIAGDHVTLVIHMDRLVLDTTFNAWIIDDFKTVQSLGKGLEFDIDLQGLTYALVLQHTLGITATEFRHTMLKRVKRTGTAKPPFYARVPMSINAHQFAAQERHLRGVLCDMITVYQRLDADPSSHHDVAYPNPMATCSWDCTFLPICGMHDNGTDVQGVRNAIYVRRDNKESNT